MTKFLLFLINLVFLPTWLFAQNNLVTTYNPHWNLLGSRQLPSQLGIDKAKVQISVISPHVYGGNTAIGFGAASNLTTREINSAINRLRPRNNAGAGADLDWLAVGIKLNREDRELLTFSVMVTERTGANLVFTDNLMKLLWRGNKQYAGQRIDLGPVAVNYTYFREYAAGAAMPLQLGLPDTFRPRLGARLKYLQGYAAVHMPTANASLYTEPEGRYLDFDLDYKINTAVANDIEVLRFLDTPLGHGLATDLGITVQHKERFSTSLSVLDLGFISYRRHTAAHTLKGNVRYEGMEIDDLFQDAGFDIDSSLVNTIKGEKTEGGSFTMPTSARLMLQAEYKVPGTTRKNRPYIRSALYLTYIQGVTNLPGSTTRPFFAAGALHSINDVLNVGASLGYGGFNRLAIGAFGSVRAGALRVGAGSSNMMYLVARNSTTGADFSLNMTLAFGGAAPSAQPFMP